MKWNYLLPRFALAAILWFFFAFAFDPLIRMGLVKAGKSLTGMEVDVLSLQTGFFPPSIKTGQIKIASHSDDKRNLVTFDQVEMKLSGKPLMYRNLIVEEATVSGMEFDTLRSKTVEDSQEILEKQDSGFDRSSYRFRQTSKELGSSWLNVFKKSAAAQLDPKRLETVRVSKEIQQEWEQRFTQYDARLQQVRLEVDSVQNKVKTAAGKTIDKIKTYAKSADRVDQLVKTGQQIRNDLKTLPQIAQHDYRRIEQAKERDLANINQLVESVSPDPQKILHALIGEELSQQLEQVFGWSSKMLQAVKTVRDQQEPERIQGEWIDFRRNANLPGVLFKKIRLTGTARVDKQKFPFVGIVKDLSSSPSQYQKPIVLQAQVKAESDLKFVGDLKFYEDNPTHDFVVLFKRPHQKKITIENSERLSLELIADVTECKSKLSFREQDFQCRIEFNQTPVGFQLSTSQAEYQSIARVLTQSLAGIDSISATLYCSGSYERPEWKVESELGEKIADGLNIAFQAEILRQKQKVAQQIEQLASQEREKLIQKLNTQYSEVLAILEKEEAKVNAVIQKVSNRPLDIRRLLR